MTQTPRVPKTELTGLQGSLLKMAVRKKLGQVPDNIEVMWNHPAGLQGHDADRARTEKWDRLDHNLGDVRGHGRRRRDRLQRVPGPQLLHGARARGSRVGQGARGAALAGLRGVHAGWSAG